MQNIKTIWYIFGSKCLYYLHKPCLYLYSLFCNFFLNPQKSGLPRFSVKGRIDSAVCCLKNPLTGHVEIESCDAPIKSVEIQLVRVETCGCAEGYARDGKCTVVILSSPGIFGIGSESPRTTMYNFVL